ncbi:unnamed protein product [Alopecurus aequalis]
MPDSTGATILDDLPESILIEEIFLRLPSEDVLRCRAVRKSWRAATSTRTFMLDHHARQPSLPIIDHVQLSGTRDSRLLVFRCDAADGTLRPVIRCTAPSMHHLTLHAALDGLLLVSSTTYTHHTERLFYPGPWPLLFEVDGILALCGTSDGTRRTDVEVWVMQDYEAGVWALTHRISILSSTYDSGESRFVCRMVVLNEREFLIRFSGYRLLRCHFDGDLLRDTVMKCEDFEDRDCGMELTLHSWQESIIPLLLFEMQEDDGANKEHPSS